MNKLITKNFWIRALSGAGLVAVIAGCIWISPYSMLALMCAICMGCMLEFYKLARLAGAESQDTYPVVLGLLIIIGAFFARVNYMSWGNFLILVPAVSLIFIAELYRKKENPFANIAWALSGIVYVAVPMAMLTLIGINAASVGGVGGYIIYRPLMIFGVFLIVWANDIGAYIFGLLLGRHRLLERISPKKSWEGFFGGILCAVGTGLLISIWQDSSFILWVGAAVVTSLAAVAGDLVESMLKRSVGVKDSGNAIPGHGGILDRFDALLMAVPFVFTYFILYFTL